MNNKTYKNPSQFRAFLSLAWFAFLAQTRNPASFAFGFIFPVVFISIFGIIGGTTPKLIVGIATNTPSSSTILQVVKKQTASFITLDREDETTLETKLRQGKIDGILQVTKEPASTQPVSSSLGGRGEQGRDEHVNLLTSTASPQNASELTSIMGNIVDKENLTLSGITAPPITLQERQLSGRQSRYIDFALPGQIGFSLLSTALFGTVFGFIFLKKAFVLKRMFATPTRALTILLSQGASRLIISLLQTFLILLIGVVVFKFYLPHGFMTFLELCVLSIIGLIAFLGFGYFFAGIANDENSAGPLINLVTLPQFLLSGTFFPTSSLPGWVQPIANNLPLSYFNMAVRKITTEQGSFHETFPYLIGLLIWGAVMYILAAKTFKWE